MVFRTNGLAPPALQLAGTVTANEKKNAVQPVYARLIGLDLVVAAPAAGVVPEIVEPVHAHVPPPEIASELLVELNVNAVLAGETVVADAVVAPTHATRTRAITAARPNVLMLRIKTPLSRRPKRDAK
jgi:hypothetical protein